MLSISIITPTFNSMRTFDIYMSAIINQTYPHDLIEIIFADGGSTDGTIEKINNYKEKINIPIKLVNNSLRTAEAGKAVGTRLASNDIICLLDSDNIIPNEQWLTEMMKPFEELDIIATEPISYTWRKTDNVINRYCALIGMNDPLCFFTGNYDRTCLISNTWTKVEHEEIDKGAYLSIRFNPQMIPTIGANGFFMQRQALLQNFTGDYLFDIDVLWILLQKNPQMRIAKVKIGIIHLFCSDVATFYRKQNRRICDFLYFSTSKGRTYPWNKVGKSKIILFAVATITIIPLLIQAIMGYIRKHDLSAWAFHIPACWITLWVYGWGTIKGFFIKKQANRDNWKQ